MSNIPLNTVASVLGTANLQREAAVAIDRKTQEAARSQRLQVQKNLQHIEEVEDPSDNDLEAVQDENQRRSGGEEKESSDERQASAHVEIAGIETDAPPPAAPPPPTGFSHLDISA